MERVGRSRQEAHGTVSAESTTQYIRRLGRDARVGWGGVGWGGVGRDLQGR